MEPTTVSIFSQVEQMVEADHAVELPATIIAKLEQAGLDGGELSRIVAPRDVVLKLVEDDQPLSPELADRVSRLARVMSLAERVFGNSDKAFLWMRMPNKDLGDAMPTKLLERESGAHLVEDALMRIEYGIFA